jgi:hypothetical protein
MDDDLRAGAETLAVAGDEVVVAEAADEDELLRHGGEPRRRRMAAREAVRYGLWTVKTSFRRSGQRSTRSNGQKALNCRLTTS